MGSLRVGHDWVTSLSLFSFMHWRKKWQPTPVFLPGESQGRRSLVGCRLWGHTDRTRLKRLSNELRNCLHGTWILLLYFKTGGDLWVGRLISKLNCLENTHRLGLPWRRLKSRTLFVCLLSGTLFQETIGCSHARTWNMVESREKFISWHLCLSNYISKRVVIL